MARQVLPALETTHGAIVNVLATLARTPNPTPRRRRRRASLVWRDQVARERGRSQRHSGERDSHRPHRVRAEVRRAADANVALEDFYATMRRTRRSLGPSRRAEEFADLAAFLLSPRASYVTGVGISIDVDVARHLTPRWTETPNSDQ